MFKIVKLMSCTAAAALLAAASVNPSSAQETPKRGGTVVYALTADPVHLNAALTNDLNAQQTSTQIFSQLLTVDKSGQTLAARAGLRLHRDRPHDAPHLTKTP